ncbi:hypothetical protein W02_29440 [Nitrospira sp. KM1]|uniref:PilZ domain-containing protein n=1 Tax=Nitrospira sp. KM1 TaxID=1936990 RepID=UPI0013A742CE|nr:PilZ domain-containing protein [Nitrospira sp. KM1]BCA55804.1 hypothetical protein W02_29440 [Nitrospira sp. KM1]
MKTARGSAVRVSRDVPRFRNRRQHTRAHADCRLMYSAEAGCRDVLMGDGTATDLSHHGLGVHGTVPVRRGTEVTLFLYLPDGQDPLLIMESRVTWTSGHRFGVEITKMNLRERNRLHYFLSLNPKASA